MKHLITLITLVALFFVSNTSAFAQSREIGDIFGDIFKANKNGQNQGQYPYQSMIENIPVTVRFDAGPNGLPKNTSLVVSAFAPPASNVRRSSPLLIGETRILLSRLSSPLELSIAASSAVTSNIDYARIEAKIMDRLGNTLYELRNSGEYRGAEAPILTLDRIGSAPQTPTPPNQNNSVHGTVDLGGATPQFRGSTLVVRLLEDGLAGGQGQLIVGKTRLSLDGKTAPFNFSFELAEQSDSLTPMVLEAWIEDWAGRKTHTMPQPMGYNGSGISYRLPLRPTSTNIPTPPTQSTGQFIKGEARFNAYKGLPAGSLLIATLEYNANSSRPSNLAQTTVPLDGLSGNVPFTLDLLDQRIAPSTTGMVIRVRIESKSGQVFFSNPGGKALVDGFNAVDLQASPQY